MNAIKPIQYYVEDVIELATENSTGTILDRTAILNALHNYRGFCDVAQLDALIADTKCDNGWMVKSSDIILVCNRINDKALVRLVGDTELKMTTDEVTELYKGELGSSYYDCVTSSNNKEHWLAHPMAVSINATESKTIEVDLGEQGYSLMFVGDALDIAYAHRFLYDFEDDDDNTFFEQDDEDLITLDLITEYIKKYK